MTSLTRAAAIVESEFEALSEQDRGVSAEEYNVDIRYKTLKLNLKSSEQA